MLQEGIGDTIRVSLTPAPGGDRTEEVRVAQQILPVSYTHLDVYKRQVIYNDLMKTLPGLMDRLP